MQKIQEVLEEVGEAMRATNDKASPRYFYLFGVQQALLHIEYGETMSSPLSVLEVCRDLKD